MSVWDALTTRQIARILFTTAGFLVVLYLLVQIRSTLLLLAIAIFLGKGAISPDVGSEVGVEIGLILGLITALLQTIVLGMVLASRRDDDAGDVRRSS